MVNNSTTRFSNRVEDYVKYRPGYPVEIVKFLHDNYSLTQDKLIADIGAGTGISTALFLNKGYRVIAVEPNDEMRVKSVELLGTYHGFMAHNGTAENTGLTDASVDAVIAGQAFHWFDTVLTRAEFKRILKPGGIVALIWNERKTSSAFEQEYDELIIKHARDYVKVDHRNIDTEHIAAFFNPEAVHLEIFQNKQVFDFEGLKGRLMSSSYMPAKDDEGFDDMIADLQVIFDKFKQDGMITINYDTKVYSGKL
ncbi:class I SAM-dependent methyltransferase [Mucilaginibacter celer]|uniref:Methyltransferase domain-containing protein n=1 Tax=Mucilaginibacter celer TaxID=2305508 RepID=A0A494W0U0_9SPHI|nr:class I SAM-dependent methyltransferase [Mucilaginibacter celer]AYL97158.1 methyltransferase domain-containing protein [Mucilaginibacter celer]